MRRLVITGALIGVGVLVARALAPRLHARLMAGCERMFEQMPDSFPPKRMLRGIEEIRASSARTVALLEARAQAAEVETHGEALSAGQGATRLLAGTSNRSAAVGASPRVGVPLNA
jgi:hypothetical protein